MKKELLAPAGDFETLKQAIHNGCDAVYLGGKMFGARKFAPNFDNDQMVEAIKYAHLYGVRVYVTVNTIIYENEVNDYIEYLTFLHKNGVDAVIMQDIGMISLVRKVLPNLDIHVSTQAHTHNINQIKYLETLGVKRVVVARELSLEEIKKLDTNLEIEAFIHGAICVCYSGQCLFSSLLLNRSGNRGECAGICRLPFKLLENDKEVETNGEYILSPMELNTTNRIKELLESNIASFKIEGRMKNSYTIGYITRLYRYLIDHYYNNEELVLTESEKENLEYLFNRGFTEGYLFNKKSDTLMNITSPNHVGVEIGKVIDFNKKKIKIKLNKELNQEDGIRFREIDKGMIVNYLYDEKDNLINSSNDIVYVDNKIGLDRLCSVYKTISSKLVKELNNYELKKIPISIKCFNKNKTLYINISDGINNIEVSDTILEEAINSGTSNERILEQLSKLGDSPFKLDGIDIDIKDKVFVPISKLNELRRKGILELINIRENTKKEVIINSIPKVDKLDINTNNSLSVLVRNKQQLEACLKENIDTIYVTDYKLYLEYKDNKNIYLRLDRVINNFIDFNNSNLLVSDTGSIYYYKNNNINTDYFMNVVNSYNILELRRLGVNKITMSIESSIDNICDVINKCGNKDIEVIIYLKPEVMITKYCLLNMLVNKEEKCNVCRNGKIYKLKDRNNEIYPLIQDKCLTHIFNYRNIELDKDIDKLKDIGIKNFRVELFDEDYDKSLRIIEKYKTLIN